MTYLDQSTFDHIAQRCVERAPVIKPSPFEQACADLMAAMEQRENKPRHVRNFINGQWVEGEMK